MGGEFASVELQVGVEAGSDPEELAEWTARLRRQLLDLDVAAVDRPETANRLPEPKVSTPIALGTLVVTLARSAGALTAVTRAVESWLTAQRNRTVRLELDGDTIELVPAALAAAGIGIALLRGRIRVARAGGVLSGSASSRSRPPWRS